MTLWVLDGAMELGPVIAGDILWLAGGMLILSCLLQFKAPDQLAWRGLLGWCFIISAYLLRHGILRFAMAGSIESPEAVHWIRIVSMTHSATRTFLVPMVLTLVLLGSVWIRWLRGRSLPASRLAIAVALLLLASAVYGILVWLLWRETEIEGGVLQRGGSSIVYPDNR